MVATQDRDPHTHTGYTGPHACTPTYTGWGLPHQLRRTASAHSSGSAAVLPVGNRDHRGVRCGVLRADLGCGLLLSVARGWRGRLKFARKPFCVIGEAQWGRWAGTNVGPALFWKFFPPALLASKPVVDAALSAG